MIGPLLATMYALGSYAGADTSGVQDYLTRRASGQRKFRDDWDQRRVAFRKRVERRRAANRRAKVSRRANRGGR